MSFNFYGCRFLPFERKTIRTYGRRQRLYDSWADSTLRLAMVAWLGPNPTHIWPVKSGVNSKTQNRFDGAHESIHNSSYTIKGGSRSAEKSLKVMMMMTAVKLGWLGAVKNSESKMVLARLW